MNLTKYHKSAIVRSIMNDIPQADAAKEKTEAQSALVKGMSQGCKTIYKRTPNALSTVYCRGDEYNFCGWQVNLVCGDADHKTILAPFKKNKQDRSEIESKVTMAIESVRTRKQFIDRFPEFSIYAPEDHEVSTTLPAVQNIIADLVKVGWIQKVHKGTVKIKK